jgi:cell wall assembly regulator SMI1
LVRNWKMLMQIDQDDRDQRRDNMGDGPHHLGKVLTQDFWYPGWIPLGTHGAAGTLFLDISPGEAGVVGQLVDGLGIDTDDQSVKANSLNEYLSCLASCLEVGKLRCVGGQGWLEPRGETVYISNLRAVWQGRII